MTKCKNCPNLIVGPRHFREYPSHEPVIGAISPGGRKILLEQINNQRMYSRLGPQAMNSERSRRIARKTARSLERSGMDVGRYAANSADYGETLEGADDLGSRVGINEVELHKTAATNGGSHDMFWWVAIPAVAVAIVILIRKLKGEIDMSNLNADEPHNVPYYPVDLLESEVDVLHPDSFGMEYQQP